MEKDAQPAPTGLVGSVDHTPNVEVTVKSKISAHCWELNTSCQLNHPTIPGLEELPCLTKYENLFSTSASEKWR